MPFRTAAENLEFLTGARVSESTVRRETLVSGKALAALETKAVDLVEVEAPVPPPAATGWLQLSVDGAMVPLVGGQWAEVRTLAVGRLRCGEAGAALKAGDLSYFSRMTDHATFTRLATIETHRRNVEQAKTILAVFDGAGWIPEFISVHCPDAIQILDWAHASGYVHAAGHSVFGETCTSWCTSQLDRLREGEPIAVLAELARLEDSLPDEGPARSSIAQSLAYLAKRFEQIQYATFIERGYPIGSGIVESANRTVVQARMKGAGMHWAASSVNPLLALRSTVCSDRWRSTWPAIAGQRRNAERHRRICQHERRSLAKTIRPRSRRNSKRPPRVVDGKPTKDHAWKRHPAVTRRRAKL